MFSQILIFIQKNWIIDNTYCRLFLLKLQAHFIYKKKKENKA